ncbi:hypothetical protein [Streptococcus dentiloxodontae]
MKRLFTNRVTRLTILGPLAAAIIGLHRGNYSMAVLWTLVAILWTGLVYKQRR